MSEVEIRGDSTWSERAATLTRLTALAIDLIGIPLFYCLWLLLFLYLPFDHFLQWIYLLFAVLTLNLILAFLLKTTLGSHLLALLSEWIL